jgi:DNA polymerase (family X)
MTNLEIAQLLRKVSAAYLILNENRFKIIAYDRAADSIEHLTREVKDMWDDGKLGDIPGVGQGIAHYLDELFREGRVRHFDEVLSRLPASIFPLLLVPGIGPKKAYKLVTELKLDNAKTVIDDLQKAAKDHTIAPMEGFGDKSEADILANIDTYKRGAIKENRMSLSDADKIAGEIKDFLKNTDGISHIETLGSLRRRVASIGDIDLAVATSKPEEVIARFVTYPHQKLIEQGPTGASLLLHNGRQVDMRVQSPKAYGAMLQYFTGSKNHNIKLRELALTRGKSLNEYGIKDVKTKKVTEFKTEQDVYASLGLDWIAPELREDRGEIEAALRSAEGKPNGLPKLVEVSDIKGDLHVHSSYDLDSSHDLGADDAAVCLGKAAELGYEYVGFSDHNPSVGNHSASEIISIMEKRKHDYEQQYYSWVKKVLKKSPPQMFLMCEVDILPDGKLALPDGAFEFVDAVVVSVHSSFAMDRDQMTKRVVSALTSHPKVRIFGHPTARLIGKREGIELDWKKIFDVCKTRDIALEINAAPERLDVPDTVVYDAKKEGIRFCIDTDAHASQNMTAMKYGVSVARRGWATKHDIVNCMEYNKFKKWLMKGAA